MLRETPSSAAIEAIEWSGSASNGSAHATFSGVMAGGRPRRWPRARAAAPSASAAEGAWCLLVDQIAAGAFSYQSVITLVRCTTFRWRMIGAEAFGSKSSLVGQNEDGLEYAGRAMSNRRAIKRSPGCSPACLAELTLRPKRTTYHASDRRPGNSTNRRSIPGSRR